MDLVYRLYENGTLTTFAWIFAPYIIGKMLPKKQNPLQASRPPKPSTKGDKFVQYLCIATCILTVYIFRKVQPYDFLNSIGASVDDPSYIVRNKFRVAMVSKYETWTEGSSLNQFSDDIKLEIGNYEKMYDRLKSKQNRKLYSNAGHDAFTNCDWCTDHSDYFIYNLPSVGFTYLIMGVIVGLSSFSNKKDFWRPYGLLYLIVLSLIDLYVMSYGLADVFSEMPELLGSMPSSFYLGAYKLRYGGYAFLALMMIVINRSQTWTTREILRDIFRSQQSVYNRYQAYRLAKASVLGDSNLRRGYFEFFKQQEAEKNAIFKNEEFKEIRQKTLRKFNMDELMEEAKQMTIGMGVGFEADDQQTSKRVPSKKDDKLHILENSDEE